ncbi:hypothetical protein BDV96DRAFT_641106 [Lophiotrema nucula]|uniref:Nephrocystin 3-like N-terminal domain-containing protein n=1 Tax=Lophiotrema nucula TaxID=690887 RepID=A0A6A5ZN58_9PLEO|nr:hypothetical protein BDV96DRAFT_641106 [Lophiotrema nucula]
MVVQVVASLCSPTSWNSAQTPLVLTHFFRASTNESSTRAISLTASILFQWLRKQDIHKEQHYAAVLRLLHPLLGSFPTYAECPFKKLWPILECALELTPEFTLAVDALDESRAEDDSFDLWRRLCAVGLFKNSRVVLLSRYRDDLDKRLPERVELKMDAQTVTPDILLFAQEEIQKTLTLQPLGDEILQKTLADADGMFLWARMMIDYLKLAASHRAQRNRLQRFPKGLAAIYEKFLQETQYHLTKTRDSCG